MNTQDARRIWDASEQLIDSRLTTHDSYARQHGAHPVSRADLSTPSAVSVCFTFPITRSHFGRAPIARLYGIAKGIAWLRPLTQ